MLGLRVTWEKRYITLGPVATLLGLAFRAYDPDHLRRRQGGPRHHLRADSDLASRRQHRPPPHAAQRGVPERPELGQGRVHSDGLGDRRPADARPRLADADGIASRRAAESRCLRRAPAWPSSPCARPAAMRACARSSRRRSASFEGIEEALDAHGRQPLHDGCDAHADRGRDRSRRKAGGAVGDRQATISPSAARRSSTTRWTSPAARASAWGRRISWAPRTCSCPVAITVEGANILTRSLIVFGQGAIRCHPYVLKEIEATRETDPAAHRSPSTPRSSVTSRFALSNMARTLVTGLTGSHFVARARRTWRRRRGATTSSSRASRRRSRSWPTCRWASLGGALKRKEKLSARLGDILSLLYLCSATLKRYEIEGRQQADAPLMHWAIWDAMFKAQTAFEGVISNFPNRFIARAHAPDRVSARPAVRRAVGRARARGREAADRAVGDARPPDRGHVHRRRRTTIRSRRSSARSRRRSRPSRSRRRFARRRRKAASTPKLAAGDGIDALVARARGRGRHQRRGSARCCVAARDLAAKVIRVDDFAQDLGALATCMLMPPSVAPAATARSMHKRRGVRHAGAVARLAPARAVRDDRTGLHHRRRAHAVPQGAQPARAVRGVRSRDRRGPRAARCASASTRRSSTR